MKILHAQLVLALMLFGSILQLQSMTVPRGSKVFKRTSTAGTAIPQTDTTFAEKYPNIPQEYDINVPQSTSEDFKSGQIPTSDITYKEFATASPESEDTAFGSKMRRWFASWFGTSVKPVKRGTGETTQSPFGRGGQKRSYTTRTKTQTEDSGIFQAIEPSFGSGIPFTQQYNVEKKFEAVYKRLNYLQSQNQNQINFDDVKNIFQECNELGEMIIASHYSPLNRKFDQQNSFFCQLFIMFGRMSYTVGAQQKLDRGVTIADSWATIITKLYDIGARFNEQRDEKTLMKIYLKDFTGIKDVKFMGGVHRWVPLQNFVDQAERILSWYNLCKHIGLEKEFKDIASDIDLKYMQILFNIARINNEFGTDIKKTIDDLLRNPKSIIGQGRAWDGQQWVTLTGEYVLDLLRKAGFSGIWTQEFYDQWQRYQEYAHQQTGGRYREQQQEQKQYQEQKQQKDQGQSGSREKSKSGTYKTPMDEKIEKLKQGFSLGSDASATMVMQKVRTYIKNNHPDILQRRADISQEEKDKKAKKFGEFMGKYDDAIEELKKREKEEKKNQK